MNIDPNTTKYMVKAKINADGIIENPDVVGAIFGQTEGLLGDDLDLRVLQKSGRIGRIEVEVVSKGGKSEGIIYMSSSLDQVETVILASALETVDRVGPCKASIHVLGIEDVRITKREKVVERAKELLNDLIKQSKGSSYDLMDSVRQSVQVEEITSYGKDKCPAGPNVKDSGSIIIVEGRSDVLNLLKAGIKNAIAVEGTNIPKTVQELSRERVATAFVDGDRGGELILRELFQVAEIDFVARAPRAHEVEELTSKQIIKCLRNKVPGDQYMEMNGLVTEEGTLDYSEAPAEERRERRRDRDEDDDDDRRDRRERRREDREERRERRRDRDEDDDDDRRDRRERRREDREERRERRRDRDEDDDDDRRDRKERKSRFDNDAIEKFRKKKDDSPKAPAMIAPPEEVAMIEAGETPALIEPPAEEPKKSEPAEEEPQEEPKPKARRTLRGKKSSDKVLTPEQTQYRDMLLDLATTHNAKVLGEGNEVIREVAVKNLVNSLKEDSEGAVAIVFDGVISQRILDISAEKGIGTVIGTRRGNVSKMPAEITILTKEDLY